MAFSAVLVVVVVVVAVAAVATVLSTSRRPCHQLRLDAGDPCSKLRLEIL